MLKTSFTRLLGIVAASCAVVLVLAALLAMASLKVVAQIPAAVGQKVPIEDWVYRVISQLFDVQTMQQFRDDLFNRTRPYIHLDDGVERWWVIREIDLARQRSNSAYQSGEYALVVILALGSVFLDSTILGVSAGFLLTLVALALSGLVIVRVVTFRILAFKSEPYLEESTHELAIRMAFNKGPFSQGSSILIALGTLLIGGTGGRGYEIGLDFAEWYTAESQPDLDGRWRTGE